jgi:hypothetical protein
MSPIVETMKHFAARLLEYELFTADDRRRFADAYRHASDLWDLSQMMDLDFADPRLRERHAKICKALRRCAGCGANLRTRGKSPYCGKDCQYATQKARARRRRMPRS